MQKAIADYKSTNNKLSMSPWKLINRIVAQKPNLNLLRYWFDLVEVCNIIHQRSVNPNKKAFLNKALDSLEFSSVSLMDQCNLLLVDACMIEVLLTFDFISFHLWFFTLLLRNLPIWKVLIR